MTFRHPSERSVDGRGRFERLAEAASNMTSSPLFYGLCVLLVAAFVAVHAAGLAVEWRLVIGDTMTAVTLLLLTLLKNAERRAEHAVQRKLDAIAGALLLQLEAGEARSTLERAIGMEDDI